MGRKKIYTDEELKERRKEQNRIGQRKWVNKNQEKAREQNQKKQEKFRNIHPNYFKEWAEKNPKFYRANNLICAYSAADRKSNRGECTLTPEWIIENIFPKPCFYCGETGWEIMGCDRIDNSKPHTPNNVVPCCFNCNCKRGTKSFEEFLNQCT